MDLGFKIDGSDEPVSDLGFTIDSAPTDDPSIGLGFEVDNNQVDTPAFLAQEHRRILNTVGSQYGELSENINEPRTGSSNIFEAMVPEGFGKSTVSNVRAGVNWAVDDPQNVGYTDSELMLKELYNLDQAHPEKMATEEGQALRQDIEARIKANAQTDPRGAWEMVKDIASYGAEDPAGLADILLSETAYDPLLLPLVFSGYGLARVGANTAMRVSGITKALNILRAGTARQRLAASVLENTLQATAFGAGEAGIGVGYQTLMNRAAGRDPLYNTLEMGQIGAAMGFTTGMLLGAFRVIRGDASVKGSYNARAKSAGYSSFEAMVEDLISQSGWRKDRVVKYFVDNIHKQPIEQVKEIMQNKLDDIAATTPISKERVRREMNVSDVEKQQSRIRESFESDPRTVNEHLGNIVEDLGMSGQPIRQDTTGNIFYNVKNIVSDFKEGLNYIQGLTRAGTRSTGEQASIRQSLFDTYDPVILTQWLKQGGAKRYAELLQRIEANKLKYDPTKLPAKGIYKQAFENAIGEMDVLPSFFKRKGLLDKVRDPVKATMTRMGKGIKDLQKNPNAVYQAMRDAIVDGTKNLYRYNIADPLESVGQFGKDLIYGEAPGYAKARHNVTNLLRDWEGNQLAGQRSLRVYSEWLKREVADPQRREAMAHLMEGEIELSRYNTWRVKNGFKEIILNEQERKVAASVRKFFDDMLDWAQRSDLFTMFRNSAIRYEQAQNFNAPRVVGKKSPRPSKARDEEIWNFVDSIENPFDMMERLGGTRLGHYTNYVPHLPVRKFAPTETDLLDWSITDAHRAGQLSTRARFEKPRIYETLMDGIEAGEKYYTRDIASLVSLYGKSMLKARMNQRLIRQLGKMENPDGVPMIGERGKVPDYYVEFKHPNFRDQDGNYLHVNPNIAPDLRMYFDTSDPTVANRVLQNIVLISKRLALGLSFFHIAALGWSGVMAGQDLASVTKNILPSGGRLKSRGLKMLDASDEGVDVQMGEMLMRNGLGMGALEELKGDTLITGMRTLATWTEGLMNKNKYFKPLGGSIATGIRGVARGQEMIDNHLWNHVNSGLKATTYLEVISDMILRDAKLVNDGKQAKLTDMNLLAQRAAQFTNDAYGNQNWNQMAMNVQNHMGHRIAAAMNKPSMRGYIRMLVFAPDWSTSNVRVIGKAFSGMVPLGKKELAHREYAKYALRSAVLFAFINEITQQMAGQGSIFDEEGTDLMYANIGNGKKLQYSKQLAEVMSLVIHGPLHVATGKIGTLPQALTHTDSLGDFVGFGLERSTPIALKQIIKNPSSGISGILGVPVYEDR